MRKQSTNLIWIFFQLKSHRFYFIFCDSQKQECVVSLEKRSAATYFRYKFWITLYSPLAVYCSGSGTRRRSFIYWLYWLRHVCTTIYRILCVVNHPCRYIHTKLYIYFYVQYTLYIWPGRHKTDLVSSRGFWGALRLLLCASLLFRFFARFCDLVRRRTWRRRRRRRRRCQR